MNGCFLNLTLHQWLVIASLPASAFAHPLPSILSIIQMDWALKNKPTHVTSLCTSSQKQHTTLRKNPNVFTRAYKALLDEPPASLSSLAAPPSASCPMNQPWRLHCSLNALLSPTPGSVRRCFLSSECSLSTPSTWFTTTLPLDLS